MDELDELLAQWERLDAAGDTRSGGSAAQIRPREPYLCGTNAYFSHKTEICNRFVTFCQHFATKLT